MTVDAREAENGRIRISIAEHRSNSNDSVLTVPSTESLDGRLARRLLEAQGGVLSRTGLETTVELTSETTTRVAR